MRIADKRTILRVVIYKSPAEIQNELARRLRTRRLERNLSQADLAQKTGLACRSIQTLETHGTSSVTSLVRVLHALDLDCSSIVPVPPRINPIAIFEAQPPRRRASRSTLAPAP